MLYNSDALNALEIAADEPEENRSSFWQLELQNFTFTQDGKMDGLICIGSLSGKKNNLVGLFHWLLQLPYRFISINSHNARQSCKLARQVARQQNRAFTQDMLRQALSIAIIQDNVERLKIRGINLVIGDGFGVMTALLKLLYPNRQVIVVNLTTPLLIDLVYVRKINPTLNIVLVQTRMELEKVLEDNSIDIIAIRADNMDIISEAEIGLAINIQSMQEMTNKVINSYFKILRGNKSEQTIFYCCNRVHKKLYDGEEIEFLKYPWSKSDQILLDEICKWDNFDYSWKPPFWIKTPNQTRHRLTIMGKVGPAAND